jgi:hypothetical protein
MAIPVSILRQHVLEAIEEIERNGVPRLRQPSKFDLVFREKRFPLAHVLSIASRLATGIELSTEDSSGEDAARDSLGNLGFEIQSRRADWTADECYMAVWAYDRIDRDRTLNKAALYREVAALIGRVPKAVEWKVQNVSACDPRSREEKPVAQAANKQALLEGVFSSYWKNRSKARERYAQVLQQLTFGAKDEEIALHSSQTLPDLIIEEGALGFQESFRRSRSRELLLFARDLFRKGDRANLLRCTACGFTTPRGISREIVQLHHIKPISLAGEHGRRMSLTEACASLLPLCPTCHAIAHSTSPPMILRAIRSTLEGERRSHGGT